MPEGIFQAIKERIDLVEYARGSHDLVKRGGLSYTLCPFHNERDASCAIYPDHYHCFGCQAHGDIFDWIEQTEHCTSEEAFSRAAQYAGVTIDEKQKRRIKKEQRERSALLKDMEAYIRYDEEENAITIPILDGAGRPLSISLRRIEGEPRYQHFNTLLFKCKKHLFNADSIRNPSKLYVVEGQMDAIALAEVGLPAVATYGEAISAGQADTLARRFADIPIVLVPDQDADNAKEHNALLRRNVHMIREVLPDCDLRVAKLSLKDANDVLIAKGRHVLQEEVANPIAVDEYLLTETLKLAESRQAEYTIAQKIVRQAPNAMVQEDLCNLLADRWGREPEIVKQYISGASRPEHVAYVKRAPEIVANYEEYADSVATPVFKFPWPSFNRRIRAIIPGHVLAFIARTSVGKTMWGLNLIEHCLREDPQRHIMLFTFEQPDIEILGRLMAIQSEMLGDPDARVNPRDLEIICRAREQDKEWTWRKEKWLEQFANLSVVERPLDAEGIEAAINEASMDYGPVQVAIIDYLGLVMAAGEEYERISGVARDMALVAKATKTFFIYLHQISRKGKQGKTAVTLEMARGSGVIEESVDYMIGAWRPMGYDDPTFEAAILKNRHGAVGQASFYFDPTTLAITERESPWEPQV